MKPTSHILQKKRCVFFGTSVQLQLVLASLATTSALFSAGTDEERRMTANSLPEPSNYCCWATRSEEKQLLT